MSHSTTSESIAEFLEEHPRMMGVLFATCLLLIQAGNAMANAGSTIAGP